MSLLTRLIGGILTRDHRRTERKHDPAVVAHYWTGSAPEAQRVGDISWQGMYLLTEHRWCLGTIIRITLQRSDGVREGEEHSVTVQAKVTRLGTDGVAFAFILADPRAGANGRLQQGALGDKGAMNRFLS
jgi:hypothetical protein